MMSSSKRPTSALALLVILSFVLAACAGAPQANTTTSVAEQTPTTAAAPTVAPTIVPEPTVAPTTAPETTTAPTTAPEATAAETATGEAATETATGETATAASASAGMRQLKGKITVAIEGAVTPPGAPATTLQTAWQNVLAKYKELQPDVEVVIEDLPPGQSADQWCEARKQANSLPDISMVANCNYFAPTAQEFASGAAIATDFASFADEINPYTGKPWRADWPNDFYRTGRCTQSGALEAWTCQTDALYFIGVLGNLDILKEYGYDQMPATYTELWELSDKINKDGKYAAWDNSVTSMVQWFPWTMYTNLAMDRAKAAGVDYTKPTAFGEIVKEPNWTTNFCNGTYTASNNPSIQEALSQIKRFADNTSPGGGAAFFDPTRDNNGQAWLTGKAAFRFDGSWFYGSMLQAEKDGALAVKNWAIFGFPKLTKDDLINKDLPIYFDGEGFISGVAGGDIFAPIGKVRGSGEDPNVDLIVRDFFQFLSSPLGQQRIIDTGGISPNPDLADKMPPGLAGAVNIKPKAFENFVQPPAPFANPIMNDAEKSVQAWMAGAVDFETAVKRADDNARIALVTHLNDSLEALGLKEIPAECQPWAPK